MILQENAPFIRHELAQVMRMRTVPVITFKWDKSMEYGSKMDELFKKIHAEESPAPENGGNGGNGNDDGNGGGEKNGGGNGGEEK